MDQYILEGFKSEMEKNAFLGKSIAMLLKGTGKIAKGSFGLFKKAPLTTTFGGLSAYEGASRARGSVPKITRVPGS